MNTCMEKTDIRMLKYKNYIKNHPRKAYGYYCMGELFLLTGDYKTAEEYFNRALSINGGFTRAMIGLISVFAYQCRFLKAVRYYNSNIENLTGKHIYGIKLASVISCAFDGGIFSSRRRSLISSLFYKYEMKILNDIYNKDPGNLAANLLLCIDCLSTCRTDDRAVVIYNACVGLDGICDGMRWSLVKALSKDYPSIYGDKKLAAKFSGIPDASCRAEYINTIFEAALEQKNIEKSRKLLNSLNSLKDCGKSLPPRSLWKYVNLCIENSIYDASVLNCCRKLIMQGWIDSTTAKAMKRMKEFRVAAGTEQEDRILELYGYK